MRNYFSNIVASVLGRARGGGYLTETIPFDGLDPKTAANAYSMYRLFSPLQKCVNEIYLGTQNTKPWIYKANGEINEAKSFRFQKLQKDLIKSGDLRLLVLESTLHGAVFFRKKLNGIYFEGYEILQNRFASPYFVDGKLITFSYKGKEVNTKDIKWIDFEGKTQDQGNLFVSDKLIALQNQLNAYGFLHETLREIYGFGGAKKLVSFKTGDSEGLADAKTEEEHKKTVKELNTKFGNRKDQKRFLSVKAEATTHDLSAKVGDLDAERVNKLGREEVSVLFNVPPILLGAGAAAYNKIAEARLDFFESYVIPFANQLMECYYELIGEKIMSTEVLSQEMGHLSFAQIANSRKAATIQQMGQGLSNLANSGIITKTQANTEFTSNS